MSAAASDSFIRVVQRKNGKIIIRAMLELEKVTFESIVGKICEDFNIFCGKETIETAVRGFLHSAYYLGFIDANDDESYTINHSIMEKFGRKFEDPEADGRSSRKRQRPNVPTPTKPKNKNCQKER